MKKATIASIVVVLLIVGGLGFVLLSGSKNNSSQKNSGNTVSTNEAPLSDAVQKEQVYDPSENGKYLVIKEWNVRMKIDPTVSTVSYKMFGKDAISLRTTKSDKYEGCEREDLLGVSRGKSGEKFYHDMTPEELMKYDDPPIKAGKYYYLAYGPQAPCQDEPTKESDKTILQLIIGLGNTFESIEVIPGDGGNDN